MYALIDTLRQSNVALGTILSKHISLAAARRAETRHQRAIRAMYGHHPTNTAVAISRRRHSRTDTGTALRAEWIVIPEDV